MRVSGPSDFALIGSGSGSTPPEQFYAFNPANTADNAPIQSGHAVILRSQQTGMYCRMAAMPSAGQQGMVCDAATPAAAASLTFTGSGLAFNGVPLSATGPSQTLVLDALAPAANTALSITAVATSGGWGVRRLAQVGAASVADWGVSARAALSSLAASSWLTREAARGCTQPPSGNTIASNDSCKQLRPAVLAALPVVCVLRLVAGRYQRV